LNTAQVLLSTGGFPAISVQINQTSTITGGAVTFEGTYDGINWIALSTASVLNPTTYASVSNPYVLQANTNYAVLLLNNGFQQIRVRLNPVISGTGSVTIYWTLLAISPLSSTGIVSQPTGSNLHVVVDSGTVTANISGSIGNTAFGANLNDGAGNAITSNSTTTSGKRGIDVNVLSILGTAPTTAGKLDIKAANGDAIVEIGDGTHTVTLNSTTYSSKYGLDTNLLGTLGTAFSTAGKVDVKAADGDVFVRQTSAANLLCTASQGGAPWTQNLTQVASTSLGATAVTNFGTAPAAAAVPGVNASLFQGTAAISNSNPLFTSLTDGTTKVTVIASTAALKTDMSSQAGTAITTVPVAFGSGTPSGNAPGVNASLFVGTTAVSASAPVPISATAAANTKTNPIFANISDGTNQLTAALSPWGTAPTGTEVQGVNANLFVSGTIATAASSGVLKVGISGATGVTIDAAQNAAAPANTLSVGGVYNSTLPTITSGNLTALQTDSHGQLIVTGSLTTNNAAPAATNIGVLPAIANAAVQSYTEGNQVLLSVDTNGQLRVNGQMIIDINNSSTATLLSGGTFSGTQQDLSRYQSVRIWVLADQASAPGGLTISFSGDGSHYSTEYTLTIAANNSEHVVIPRRARYYKVSYTNGSVGQGFFDLQSYLEPMVADQNVILLNESLDSNDSGTLVRGVITGINASGGSTYNNATIKSASSPAVASDTALVVALSPNSYGSGVYAGAAYPLNLDGPFANSNLLVSDTKTQGILSDIQANQEQDIDSWFDGQYAVQIQAGTTALGSTLVPGQTGASLNTFITNPLTAAWNDVIDPLNSFTTPLSANGVFPGTFRSAQGFASLIVEVDTDQISANTSTAGVVVQWSEDGANVGDSDIAYITAGDLITVALGGQSFVFPIKRPYYRVQYTNGPNAQTIFRLQTILKVSPIIGTLVDMMDQVSNSMYTTLVRNFPMGRSAVGATTFNDMVVNSSGALNVADTIAEGYLANLNILDDIEANQEYEIDQWYDGAFAVQIMAGTAPLGSSAVPGQTGQALNTSAMPSATSLITGQKAVTATAAALPPNVLTRGITVEAKSTNTAVIYVGGPGVTTSTGLELPAGAAVTLQVANSNAIYVVAVSTGQTVTWLAY
jgi:hypothetical protein